MNFAKVTVTTRLLRMAIGINSPPTSSPRSSWRHRNHTYGPRYKGLDLDHPRLDVEQELAEKTHSAVAIVIAR